MDDTWQEWVGKTESHADTVTPAPVTAMAATLLDRDWRAEPGDTLPPLWHWLYFLPIVPMSQVGSDGHPAKGGFLPPIPLERRMWAGGRLEFGAPLRVGDDVTKQSEILSVTPKEGKAGPMVFVTVRHEVTGPAGVAVREEQDIVYLPMPTSFAYPKPVEAPADPDFSKPFPVDPVRLFRFSALTFNGHRIHYDRTYAHDVEQYPGLVIHGPLQAMALMAAALDHAPGQQPAHFSFRGIRPLFDFDTVCLTGVTGEDGTLHLASVMEDDYIGMKASLSWG